MGNIDYYKDDIFDTLEFGYYPEAGGLSKAIVELDPEEAEPSEEKWDSLDGYTEFDNTSVTLLKAYAEKHKARPMIVLKVYNRKPFEAISLVEDWLGDNHLPRAVPTKFQATHRILDSEWQLLPC